MPFDVGNIKGLDTGDKYSNLQVQIPSFTADLTDRGGGMPKNVWNIFRHIQIPSLSFLDTGDKYISV